MTVSGGTYGWSIDADALAETLVANIEAGTATTVEIPCTQSAAVYNPGGADWGSSYIDVDLTTQHARMYDSDGNLIWESDIVSGEVDDDHETPTGVYYINSNMTTNTTLVGYDEDGDGEPDYYTPVSYWMPFIGNSVAFHDAWWRSSFGGTIYVSNGSHGCINLPSTAAAELYQLVSVGTVVVVHD